MVKIVRRGVRYHAYVIGWRIRYALLKHGDGPQRVPLFWMSFGAMTVLAGILSWKVQQILVGGAETNQAFWWYLIVLVVSVLISYAMQPKPKSPEFKSPESPVVEDGASIVEVFGDVWISNPILIGWRNMGKEAIRKKGGKK